MIVTGLTICPRLLSRAVRWIVTAPIIAHEHLFCRSIIALYRVSLNTATIRVGAVFVGAVFKEALRLNSASIIVAHQHPSGSPDPSPEDILITRQLVEAGRLLDVELLDSLVIGRGAWISLRERGLGFEKR